MSPAFIAGALLGLAVGIVIGLIGGVLVMAALFVSRRDDRP